MIKQNLRICSFDSESFIDKSFLNNYPNINITFDNDLRISELKPPSDDRSYLFIIRDPGLLYAVSELSLKSRYILFITDAFDTIPPEFLKLISQIIYLSDGPDERNFKLIKLFDRIDADYKAFMGYNMLNTAINILPDMMWFKELNGLHHNVNNTFSKIVRKTKEDCEGRTHGYIWNVPEEAAFSCRESEDMVIGTKSLLSFQEPVGTDEGMKQFVTYKAPVYDMFNNIIGTVGAGHDVTDFQNMGIQLTILTENIPFPVIMCNAEWKTVRINDNFIKIFNISEKESKSLFYPDWKKKYMKGISEGYVNDEKHTATREYTIEKNGDTLSFIVIEQEIRDSFNNLSGYFCLFRDITIEREYENAIVAAANSDGLTGLYNRRYFYEYISENLESEMTLLYMDLDHFKEVNDKYGHGKGDDVLIKTAYLIKNTFPDSTVIRLGGDEFASLYLKKVGDDVLNPKIKELEDKIKAITPDSEIGLSVSVGVGYKDSNDFNSEDFIHEVDKKMYEIKNKHHEKNED